MQTKLSSLCEAIFNTVIGVLMSLLVQKVVFTAYGLKTTFNTDIQILFWFTIVSIGRSYVVRRMWNKGWWKDPTQRVIVALAICLMVTTCFVAYGSM